jgi:hypothetical protein
MKIMVNSKVFGGAIVARCQDVTQNLMSDTEAVLAENPLVEIPEGLKEINTCTGVKTLVLDVEMKKAFLELVGCSKEKPVSTLYGFFNGSRFSPFIEVSYSDRFMTGGAGPTVGVSVATAISCETGMVKEAIRNFSNLEIALTKIKYHGEVLIFLASDYTMTNISFGHFYAHFALFNEISKIPTQKIVEFCVGDDALDIFPSIVVGCLVSKQPFPYLVNVDNHILAPKTAEKHLWRYVVEGGNEIVFVTVHGQSVWEARRRIKNTLENMRKFDDFLQYRTDFGFQSDFVLSKEKLEEFKKEVWNKTKEVTS